MDSRRNELVATDLMVTIISAGFGWMCVVTGVFGMNLYNAGVCVWGGGG